jgi:hypothetical protein
MRARVAVMLSPVRLVDQWREIERGLPDEWHEARVSVAIDDKERLDRAAALLGPLAPGRSIGSVRFSATRGGGASGPEAVRRLLGRVDTERIEGRLELLETEEARQEVTPAPDTLVDAWDAAIAALPADWSDLYAEIELRSTDHLDRAALLLAPVNPARYGGPAGFRFRVARVFGYGASAAMARRCLERCDAERITGRVRILRALSDTRPVATQGPVWHVGGKTV